jgi:hypothetical protein
MLRLSQLSVGVETSVQAWRQICAGIAVEWHCLYHQIPLRPESFSKEHVSIFTALNRAESSDCSPYLSLPLAVPPPICHPSLPASTSRLYPSATSCHLSQSPATSHHFSLLLAAPRCFSLFLAIFHCLLLPSVISRCSPLPFVIPRCLPLPLAISHCILLPSAILRRLPLPLHYPGYSPFPPSLPAVSRYLSLSSAISSRACSHEQALKSRLPRAAPTGRLSWVGAHGQVLTGRLTGRLSQASLYGDARGQAHRAGSRAGSQGRLTGRLSSAGSRGCL